MNHAIPRYQDITETTGGFVTNEAADMLATRYELAAGLARGKRVLELGCGAALGFGLMGADAALLAGGDYSFSLLTDARNHYRHRFSFVQLSAETLPFADAAFDFVLFAEATYYVPRMDSSFAEIARVLAPGGKVLFVNANPERRDFVVSPFSTHYHTADQFRAALEAVGFRVETEGAFPVETRPGRGRVVSRGISLARRILETLHLTPRTLKGRARLKRLVFGKLRRIPPELPVHFGTVAPRQPLAPGPVTTHKVLYIHGEKPADARS